MSAVPEVAADKWLPLLEHSTHEVFDIMLGSKLELGQPEAITGGIHCHGWIGGNRLRGNEHSLWS